MAQFSISIYLLARYGGDAQVLNVCRLGRPIGRRDCPGRVLKIPTQAVHHLIRVSRVRPPHRYFTGRGGGRDTLPCPERSAHVSQSMRPHGPPTTVLHREEVAGGDADASHLFLGYAIRPAWWILLETHLAIRTSTLQLARVRFFGNSLRRAEGQSIPVIQVVEWRRSDIPDPFGASNRIGGRSWRRMFRIVSGGLLSILKHPKFPMVFTTGCTSRSRLYSKGASGRIAEAVGIPGGCAKSRYCFENSANSTTRTPEIDFGNCYPYIRGKRYSSHTGVAIDPSPSGIAPRAVGP